MICGRMEVDYLVIGSGVAGLSYALQLAKYDLSKKIVVLTKATKDESNTKYAQGGIAAVLDNQKDSFKSHVQDTLKAGDGLCKTKVVEIVVEKGPQCIKDMINMGTNFDKNQKGQLDLVQEGGHSAYRIAHYKDITGFEILRVLFKEIANYPNLTLLSDCLAIDLIVKENICYGLYVFDNTHKSIFKILAQKTLMATGGLGQIYAYTTNPTIATGDGIAMAKRAGAKITGMEFIQFHPTVLYSTQKQTVAFLISEAVRGHNAILRNHEGEAFMHRYDERKELASRDIVARAINNEMRKHKTSHVLLDCKHLEIKDFISHFPNIYEKCLLLGINIQKDYIPVAPAAHYLCGGIEVNTNGQTSIKNMYACGECAYTGLHGANRLASNSLLEAVVFANNCFEHTVKNTADKPLPINYENSKKYVYVETEGNLEEIKSLKMQIQELMTSKIAVVRNTKDLKKSLDQLEKIKKKIQKNYDFYAVHPKLNELKNILTTSILVVEHSIKRKINKGSFYNEDFEKK